MTRETDSQHDLLKRQLDYDQRMRVIDRLHDLIVQGSKGLTVLNGGAVIAMLAFVQAIVDKSVYQCFKPYAVSAISCFLVGAFLPAIAFFFHHTYINHAFQHTSEQMKWRGFVWGLLIVSSILALVGGALVAVGIWVAV